MVPSKEFVEFLRKYNTPKDLIEDLFLSSIIDSYSRVCLVEDIFNFTENIIRNEFQYDLENYNQIIKEALNNNFVTFIAERQIIDKEKELMRTDIEFIINPTIRFVVECKRLEGVSKSQYIDSGISRFIKPDKYIGTNEKYAGMCSFVVAGDINNIIKGTKQRVGDYHWLSTDDRKICNFEPSFTSIHLKIDGNEIRIHHLFFVLNKVAV